jgi:hypothetical protein
MRRLLLAAACLLGAACATDSSGNAWPLELSWTFADGRSCTDAGVITVTVGVPGDQAPKKLDCVAGLDGPIAAGGWAAGPLVIEALTPDGLPAYRAMTTMPDAAATLAVTLVYVGGAPPP